MAQTEPGWKLVDDRAPASRSLGLATKRTDHSSDLNVSVLLPSAIGECMVLSKLAGKAETKEQDDVVSSCWLQLRDRERAYNIASFTDVQSFVSPVAPGLPLH